MNNKSIQCFDLESLHATGVSLDYAWIEKAKFFDDFAYRALSTDPTNDAEILGLEHPRYQQLSKGWLPTTADARRKKLDSVTRSERANLFDRIHSGELWALGSRTLDNGSDEVVRIPRQHFFLDEEQEEVFQHINWKKGEMRVGSESYFDIRIVEPPASPEPASTRADTPPSKKTKGGRPSTKTQIKACVLGLLKDPKFKEMSRTEQAGEVREKILGEKHRDAHKYVGYSDYSIKRIIGNVVSNEPSD